MTVATSIRSSYGFLYRRGNPKVTRLEPATAVGQPIGSVPTFIPAATRPLKKAGGSRPQTAALATVSWQERAAWRRMQQDPGSEQRGGGCRKSAGIMSVPVRSSYLYWLQATCRRSTRMDESGSWCSPMEVLRGRKSEQAGRFAAIVVRQRRRLLLYTNPG